MFFGLQLYSTSSFCERRDPRIKGWRGGFTVRERGLNEVKRLDVFFNLVEVLGQPSGVASVGSA